MLSVSLLGTGGGIPTPNRNLSSTLLNYKGRKILIDCGEGTQVSMMMLSCGFKSLDIILITHIHGDHIIGLPGLLSTLGNYGKTEPLLIIGPEGIESVINNLRVVANYLPYEIEIIENPKKLEFNIVNNRLCIVVNNRLCIDNTKGELLLNTLELDHSANCLGYSIYIRRQGKFDVKKAKEYNLPQKFWKRLQDGEVIDFDGNKITPKMVIGDERKGIKFSFITDTRPIDTIKDFIYESDLFICEGTYGHDEDLIKAIKNKHMTFKEASTLALNGKVKKLVLTHFSPSIDNPSDFLENAIDVFENTVIGVDRETFEIMFEN